MLFVSNKKKFIKNFLNKIKSNFVNSKKTIFLNNEFSLKYNETYKDVKKILYVLRNLKKKRIAVFSNKSSDYYIIVISIIFSGNTWIQISPNIPLERIKKIIKVSKVKYGFYDQSFANNNILKKIKIKFFETNLILKNNHKILSPDFKNISPDDTAMIFFTSGSTSDPKGVKISYYSFIYSAMCQIKTLRYRKNKEIFSDYHDSSFVMSLNIIFPALYLNCTISPLITMYDKLKPTEHILKNKITVLITVPSFLLYMEKYLNNKIYIKNIIFCGENFSLNTFELVKSKIKFQNLFNCYGSTELSPWAFFYKYKSDDYNIIKKNNQLPIGRPYHGIKTFINKNNELCLSGPVLSQGYLNKKENKEKFFRIKKTFFYNTGDTCKIVKSNLYFITGRNDKQIKLKGYRINLLEVENCTKGIKGINYTLCFKKQKEEKLILIVFCKYKKKESEILNFLKLRLPSYMIPENLVLLRKIKLNKNGKVDRQYYKEKYSK